MPVQFLVYVPLGVLAFALPVLAFARRGRRLDDHPTCRRCRFDLFGAPAGATNCSECGADLRERRAIRVGNRQGHPRLFASATLLAVVSAGSLGFAGWRQARVTDWNRHKPVWWLMSDIGSRTPAVRDAALGEMARRIVEGKFDDQRQLDRIVERALDYQGDLSLPWSAAWGRLVEKAHDAGRLSDERWHRYVAQSPALSVDVRQQVRRGDPIPFQIWSGPARVGDARFGLALGLDSDPQVGGLNTPSDLMTGVPAYIFTPTAGRRLLRSIVAEPDDDRMAQLPVGAQRLTIVVGVRATTAPVRYALVSVSPPVYDAIGPQPAFVRQIELKASFTLLPGTRQTTVLNSEPVLRLSVEQAIRIAGVTCARPSATAPLRLAIDMVCSSPPIDLDYDVFVRADDWGGEKRIGHATFDKGVLTKLTASTTMTRFEAKSVDITFRPSVKHAATAMRPVEIWGGEVVFQAVPVNHVR